MLGGGATCGLGREGVGKPRRCNQRARRPRLWGLRVGRCGAHHKHADHARDAGRVEAQRLVERRRALPSRKGKAWEEARHAGRQAGGWGGGVGGASSREVPPVEAEGRARAERTSNINDIAVTLDVSKLSG